MKYIRYFLFALASIAALPAVADDYNAGPNVLNFNECFVGPHASGCMLEAYTLEPSLTGLELGTLGNDTLRVSGSIVLGDGGAGNLSISGTLAAPVASINALGIGNLNASGTVSAVNLVGDGSGITGLTKPKAYQGTTLKNNAFPIFKSATVSSGVAVFNLTADGTAGGTALCTGTPFNESVQPVVSDATASYQMSWAFSNGNKTLTVTANKLTTANILTGLLGQTAANGAVVNVTVWCN